MFSSERVCRISAALFEAPASSVVSVLRTALTRYFDVSEVELYLPDYRLISLRPLDSITGAAELFVDRSAQGRVFAAGEPLIEGSGRLLLPVTARGRRVGVLDVEPPAKAGSESLEELGEIAEVLGWVLIMAGAETDRFSNARRQRRLTVAAEIQWDLLPGGSFDLDRLALACQLEPAYAIAGDNYDWAVNGRRLTVTISNGMGEGMQAALLTSLTVGALRNARRSGADLAEQAGQAGDAVHSRHGGKEFVATLLLEVDLTTGTVQAVDAGSPILLRSPAGAPFTRVDLDQQLPLGMFAGTTYVTQTFQLEPGDRLLAVSDGMHGARSPRGEVFGERALERTAKAGRRLSATEAVRALVRELISHHDGTDLRDDAVAVCLDWGDR
jgi:serine phosphatase RsbU (regulator of sigma subunit)